MKTNHHAFLCRQARSIADGLAAMTEWEASGQMLRVAALLEQEKPSYDTYLAAMRRAISARNCCQQGDAISMADTLVNQLAREKNLAA